MHASKTSADLPVIRVIAVSYTHLDVYKRQIESGLAALRKWGAHGCVLVGDPAFYGRFGFANNPALVLAGVLKEVFLALSFGTSSPHGNVQFHTAFEAKG